MPFIGKQPEVGAYQLIDSITTSATATYALTVDGSAYFPASARNLIVSLNGVTQAPESAYTVSGSNIVFDSALTASDVIDYIMVIGDAVDIGTPSDGTVGNAQLKSDLDFSGKTLTFSNDQISGDAISGGTATLDGLTVDTNTLYVDSTNNWVGIGVSPQLKLQVKDGTDKNIAVRASTNLTNGMTILAMNDVGSLTQPLEIFGTEVSLRGASAEGLRVDSSGNVGIGTTDTNGGKLVVGDVVSGDTPFIQLLRTGVTERTNYIGLSDSDALVFSADEFNEGADSDIRFKVDGTERMRIDSSGRVGIATNSPTSTLDVSGRFTISGGSALANSPHPYMRRAGGNLRIAGRSDGGSGGNIMICTGASEDVRVTVDPSGNLLVGKTSPDLATAGGEIRANGQIGAVVASTPFFANRTAGDGALIDFYVNNTYVGKIQHTSGTVAIAQASDERLKQNVVEISGCLEEIKQIRPVSWDWNSRDGGSIGVVAQEIHQIWPDVVDEGEDGYLTVAGISRVEARLIKAIQEQQAMIETLQAQVAELQGAN